LEEFYKSDNFKKNEDDNEEEETGWISDDLVVAATDALEEYFRLLKRPPVKKISDNNLENETQMVVRHSIKKGNCEEKYPELWSDSDIINWSPSNLKEIAKKYKYDKSKGTIEIVDGREIDIIKAIKACGDQDNATTSDKNKNNIILSFLNSIRHMDDETETGPVLALPPAIRPPDGSSSSSSHVPLPAVTTPYIKTSPISSTGEKDVNDKISERCGTGTDKDSFLVAITKIGDKEKCIFFNPGKNEISVKDL